MLGDGRLEINVHELSDKQLEQLAYKVRVGIMKDREAEKNKFKERAFHNTRLLLKKYHKLKAHSEIVEEQIEINQGSFWEHKWLNLDMLMQNKAKTVKLMKHVDIALKVYKESCLNSNKQEEKRRWRVINKRFIEYPLLSEEKLAEQMHMDRSTVNRTCRDAIEDLSVILFGIDMINEW